MPSNINLSQAPYWDDFDPTKKFTRVLFKPGYPVQARELTQLQTIIQNQIEKFGKHIFEEGSLVYGGQFDIDNRVPSIKINSVDSNGDPVSPESFKGTIVVGRSTSIRAYVIDGTEEEISGSAQKVLLLRYLSGSETSDVFLPGEVIDTETAVLGASISAVVASTTPDGFGSIFSITAGAIFSNNFFLEFDKQDIITSAFTTEPTCRVGFSIDFSIVSVNDDLTLLDNSQGFLNYASPGADRLRVVPELTKIGIDDTDSLPEFVELFTIRDGIVQQKFNRPIYAIIGDEIAKRTFDESGDYCVKGMGVTIREHLDTGVNEGYLPIDRGGDKDLLAIGIEPGLAYVKGYEVSTLTTRYISTDKSTDFNFVNSQILNARTGNYITVHEVVGSPPMNVGNTILLYDTAGQRITNKIAANVSPSGSQIGTAKIKSIQKTTQVDPYLQRFNVFLYDIRMNANKVFSEVKAINFATGTHFFADVILDSGSAVLKDTISNEMIYPVGSSYTRTIKSSDNSSDTSFIFQKTIPNVTIDLNGAFTISVSTSFENFAYGVGALGDVDKRSIILSLNEAKDITLAGTVAGTSGQKVLTGTNTFFTRLNKGDKIQITDVSGTFVVDTVSTNTSMTVTSNFGSSFSGKAHKKIYLIGDHIDLSSKGSKSGNIRAVTLNTSTSMTFDLDEMFGTVGEGGSASASISFLVARNTAAEISKVLRPKRFVKINCSTLSTPLTAPIPIGAPDIFKVRQIRKHSSAFSAATDGTDVTSHFIIDNGQRDDMYDHGSIVPKSSITLASGDHLLVEFDYFYPDFSQGVGYFSIDSYPIDDETISDTTIFTHEIPSYKSEISGKVFNLRDHLDFRSVKTATAANSTTVAGATTNPTNAAGFVQDSNGLRIPFPYSQINIDYSYYLARRDVVTIDKNGNFGVVRGNSAINPVTPVFPETVMGIANVYIPPYPSLSSSYARILGNQDAGAKAQRITFSRHTMRDIGVLKERVNNLEYYATISLLEKNAADLLIQDENGLDRFKNGFFVDGFLDHSLGATYNSDYKIAVDAEEQVIRPFFKMNSFLYDYLETASTNVQKTGPLITLPYTETVLLEQTKATTYRNIEQSVYRFIGGLDLFPDSDIWVDTQTIDREVQVGFSDDLPVSEMETEWGSWEKQIVGYNVYSRKLSGAKGELLGTYSSYAEAKASIAPTGNQNTDPAFAGIDQRGMYETMSYIETVYAETRTGTKNSSTVYSTQVTTEETGSYVTDVSIVPYIRPQIIKLTAKGLKNNTRFHVFFDGENMNDYLNPLVIPSGGPALATTRLGEGQIWRSNEYGELVGLLRLPSSGKRFRIGSREIVITDSPTNSVDASSFCSNYFVAHGLIQQKQNTIISTKQPIIETDSSKVTETRTSSSLKKYGPSCMAYSFHIKAPETDDGVFLTSVEVFIESVHASLGVWFEIREMNSAGGITRTQVPYSEVYMGRDDPRLVLTTDGSAPTVVNFECPVFLMNDTQYAFVIHTEGLNPDTYFWISRLGETDIATGQQVTARQLTGNVFTTNNNLNWDIVPDIDLKIKFNRAVFNTSVTGVIEMGNKPQEFLKIEPSLVDEFVYYGEEVRGSESFIATTIGGSDEIEIGDTLIGSSSFVSSTVVDVQAGAGSTLVIRTDNSGFSNNENFTVTGKDSTGKITSIEYGTGTLVSYDRRVPSIHLRDSNGKFFEGAKITGMTSGTISNIVEISDYPYSTIYFNPNYLVFNNTSCTFQARGQKSSDGNFGPYYDILAKNNFFFGTEKSLKSRSNELQLFSGARSAQTKTFMKTNSNWVSPVVDTSRTNSIYITNIINDDTTNEDAAMGGNLFNKYISKIVTLAEGQDAEDLLVSLTAYCPPRITDKFPIKVWFKIRNKEDATPFASRPWIEMENSGIGNYSSLVNKFDFKSFDFKIPSAMMTGSYGEVQYTSGGNTFSGFKQFSIKIGLLGTDSAIVPRAADLRVIALQM